MRSPCSLPEFLKYSRTKNSRAGESTVSRESSVQLLPLSFDRELMESIGDADTLEAQSKAILMENDIRDEEFSDEVRKE
jgi:exoribonuclease R